MKSCPRHAIYEAVHNCPDCLGLEVRRLTAENSAGKEIQAALLRRIGLLESEIERVSTQQNTVSTRQELPDLDQDAYYEELRSQLI